MSTPPQTCPISLLPVELIIEIFVHCAQGAEDYPLAPFHISHVCRLWRDIAYDCPPIWQYLFLDDRSTRKLSQFQIDFWLSRSRSLPLDVHFHISDYDKLLPLIIPLFRTMYRWRRCVFSGKVQDTIEFSGYLRQGVRAHLQELQIVLLNESEITSPDSEGRSYPPSIRRVPCTTHPFSHHLIFRCSVLKLPSSSTLTTFQVTKVVLSEGTAEGIIDTTQMLEFLSFCPQVEYFQYYGAPRDPAYPHPDVPPPMVHLPKLQTLFIHSSCAVRTLLSHIDAPRLTSLYLEHTNTECDPSTTPLYPYATEDGDSDDEAGDFSQSPWSDHATGMGLRSLIRRSNPPLDFLAMDYADMRTKDFKWCFDRLKDLTVFRIVASDMSDKVIALLAPYAPHGYGLRDEDDMDVDEEEDHCMHVRLPKLISLELWNCQRLSGQAIVQALQSRVRYSDTFADGIRFQRMEEIAVMGCSGFTPANAFDLEEVVGGQRLRVG
ncbi:hypothetical protein QCA50_006796 [Cerrena zonata]|uniref:F-box domain-containing protein n=1 Tax=Cerrena zonata TaxID=2478898 RepID=A0AAW0GJS9_9APHY